MLTATTAFGWDGGLAPAPVQFQLLHSSSHGAVLVSVWENLCTLFQICPFLVRPVRMEACVVPSLPITAGRFPPPLRSPSTPSPPKQQMSRRHRSYLTMCHSPLVGKWPKLPLASDTSWSKVFLWVYHRLASVALQVSLKRVLCCEAVSRKHVGHDWCKRILQY